MARAGPSSDRPRSAGTPPPAAAIERLSNTVARGADAALVASLAEACAERAPEETGRLVEVLTAAWAEQIGALEHERALAQGRAAWLDRLHGIAERIASQLQVEAVLDTIVRAVCEHGHWTRSCILQVDADEEMEVVAQHNLGELFVPGYRLSGTGTATVEAARTRRPLVLQDVSAGDFEPARSHALAVGYQSLLAVPLPLDSDRMVLNVYSEESGSFGPLEVAYVSALASYAAIALHNARLHRRIQDQNAMLHAMLATHGQLIEMILHGNDLGYVTRTLGRVLARPIAVFNRFGDLLAASPDAEAWRAYDPTAAADALAPPSLGLVRLLPLDVGDENLGQLAVAEVTPELSDLDRIAMEQGALVVAIEMMREKTALEAEMRVRSDFLNDLLANHPSATHDRATYLGWDPRAEYDLVVVDIRRGPTPERGESRSADDAALRRRAASVARAALARSRPASDAVVHGDGIVVLAPVAAGADSGEDEPVEQLARRVHAALTEHFRDAAVTVAGGRRSAHLGEIRSAYSEGYDVVQMARGMGRGGDVVTSESLGLYAMLFRRDPPAAIGAFVERTLGPMLRHDERHRTSYVPTVRAYLEAGGSPRLAAKRLHVHVNTLIYRLKRVRELFGLDLADADSRLDVHLALKLADAVRR